MNKKITKIAIVVVALCSFSFTPALAQKSYKHIKITNPYAHLAKNIYKGNTHSHSTGSTDGRNTPTEVMTFFKSVGYDFNALTDHEAVTADPAVPGILFITGVEDGQGATGRDHMSKLGAGATATLTTDDQTSINTALAEGDYVQMNHPDGATDWSLATVLSTQGPTSVAIWNGVRQMEYAAQVDAMLNNGERLNLVAEEDLHNVALATSGLQGVHVWANKLTTSNIISGLKSGKYYSTYTPAGQTEQAITVKQFGNKIKITSNQTSTFDWYGRGALIKSESGIRSATYTIVGDEKYVRVRVTGGTAVAWTNPIYIDLKDISRKH